MKALRVIGLVAFSGVAFSAVAFADAPKHAAVAKKLPKEERVYVMDKDAPSADKTVPLLSARSIVSKNK